MADKYNDLDNYNFDDDELGFDDSFGLDAPPQKDDRKPTTVVRDSVKEAAWDYMKDENNIREFGKKALPPGYNSVLDDGLKLKANIARNLSQSSTEIKKELVGLKRAANKLTPTVERILGQKMAERFEKLTATKDDSTWGANYDPENDSVKQAMGEVFGEYADAQAATQKALAEKAAAEDAVREVRQDKQFGVATQQRGKSVEYLSQLANYFQNIDFRWKRTTLDLSLRQHYLFKRHLEVTSEGLTAIITEAKAITKNTGLPDAAKVNLSEIHSQMMSEALIGKVQGRAADMGRQFFSNFMNNITEKTQEKTREIADTIAMIKDMVDQAADMENMRAEMEEMEGGPPPDPRKAAIEFVSRQLTTLGLSKVQEKAAAKFLKFLESQPRAMAFGENLQYFSDNKGAVVDSFIKQYEDEGGVRGAMATVLKTFAPTISGRRETVNTSVKEDPMMAVSWDLQSRRTLVEVIPGWLSKIEQNSRSAMTGRKEAAQVYDWHSESFVDQKTAAKTALKQVVSENTVQSVLSQTDKLMKVLDPDNKLSEKATAALRRSMVEAADSSFGFSLRDYITGERIKSDDPKITSEIVDFFKDSFSVGESGGYRLDGINNSRRRNSAAREFRRLQDTLPESQNAINRYQLLGAKSQLRNAGLITKDSDGQDQIDHDYYYDLLMGGSERITDDGGPGPGGRGRRRRRRGGGGPGGGGGGGGPNPPVPPVPPGNTGPTIVTWSDATHERFMKELTALLARDAGESATKARDDYRNRSLEQREAILDTLRATQQHSTSSWQNLSKQIGDMTLLLVDIAARTGTGAPGGGPGGPGPGGDPGQQRWWQQSIGSLGSSILSGLTDGTKKAMRSAKAGYLKGRRFVGRFTGIPGELLNKMKQFGGGAMAQMGKLGRRYKDVYIKGMPTPILVGRELKEKVYLDVNSGKRVLGIDDITGPVVDAEGQYVITDVQFAAGLEVRLASGLFSLGGKLVDAAYGLATAPMAIASKVVGIAKRGAVFAKDVAVGAFGKVSDYLHKAADVYIGGERTPRILKSIMEGGGYYNARGEVIRKLGDIQSDVYDAAGNVVISFEEFKDNAFVFANGKLEKLNIKGRMKNFGNRVGGALKGAAKLPFALLGKAASGWRRLMENTALKTLFLKLPDDIILKANVVNVVTGGGKGAGDRDGDGVRDGSWQDIVERRRKRKEANGKKGKAGEDKKDNGKGIFGMLAGLFSGIAEKLGSVKDWASDLLGGDGLDVDVGEGRGRRGRRGAGGRRGPGGGGRGGFMRRAAGATARGAGALARGAGTALMWGGRTALTGVALAGGGLMSAGSALLSGAGAVLGFVSTPIVAGALAVLAVGYIGWNLFGYWKRRREVGKLEQLRYLQYGINSGLETQLVAVRYLEEKLMGDIKKVGNSIDILTPASEVYDEYGEDFENDLRDEQRRASWCQWYNYRFKPVFLSWVALCTGYKDKDGDTLTLPNVDDLPDDKKVEFATKTISGPEAAIDPYGVQASPFPSAAPIANRDVIMQYIGELKKLYGDVKPLNAAKATKQSTATPKRTLPGMNPVGADNVVSYATARAARLGAPASAPGGSGVGGSTAFMAAAAAPSILANERQRGQVIRILTPIEKVRFYQYGANIANATHVQSLFDLEKLLFSKVSAGRGGRFTLTVPTGKLFEQVASSFQLNAIDDNHRIQWSGWFEYRFLPCYLKFYQLVTSGLGQAKTLDNYQQQLSVYNQLDFVHAQIANRLDTSTGWVPFTTPWSPWGAGYKVPTNVAYFQAFVENIVDELQQKGGISEEKVADIKRQRAEKFEESARRIGGEDNATMKDGQQRINQFGLDRMAPKSSSATYNLFAGNSRYGFGPSNMAGQGAWGGAYGSGGGMSGFLPTQPNIQPDPPKQGPGYDKGLRAMLEAARRHGITDPKELAAFLAQAEIESGSYKFTEESLKYSPGNLMKVFPRYVGNMAQAQALSQAGPVAIANRVYGGRMGNSGANDGYTFRGRGFIQLTGRQNYEAFAKATGIDVVNDPEKRAWLSTPEGAAESAAIYWTKINPKIRQYAQKGDITNVSSLVNAGSLYSPGKQVNHLNERIARYKHYEQQMAAGKFNADPGATPGPAQTPTTPSAGVPAMLASKGPSAANSAVPSFGNGAVPGLGGSQMTEVPRVATSGPMSDGIPTAPITTAPSAEAYQQKVTTANAGMAPTGYENRMLETAKAQLDKLTDVSQTLTRIERLLGGKDIPSPAPKVASTGAQPPSETKPVTAEGGKPPLDFVKKRA